MWCERIPFVDRIRKYALIKYNQTFHIGHIKKFLNDLLIEKFCHYDDHVCSPSPLSMKAWQIHKKARDSFNRNRLEQRDKNNFDMDFWISTK